MKSWRVLLAVLTAGVLSSTALAHGVDDPTRTFLEGVTGPEIVPFMYIGAKHMVTGYDHLLFLVGVIFFLYSTKEVFLYVSLFTIGHSLTLMFGVLANISVNAYLIDAVIGFSIVYKGLDNIGGLRRILGFQPNTKAAVVIFGLFHGFGLATKIQEFEVPPDGLFVNLLAFNVGVEMGQFTALAFVLLGILLWRRHASFERGAWAANVLLMTGGLLLVGYQLPGYVVSKG
jgi:HupE / UreJ protein